MIIQGVALRPKENTSIESTGTLKHDSITRHFPEHSHRPSWHQAEETDLKVLEARILPALEGLVRSSRSRSELAQHSLLTSRGEAKNKAAFGAPPSVIHVDAPCPLPSPSSAMGHADPTAQALLSEGW